MSESAPTLDDLADRECEVWGVPRKPQRTLFDTALHAAREQYKQGMERETWVGEAVAMHSGRAEAGKRFGAAVREFLASEGIESVAALRDRHSELHERYFDLMEEHRERQAERLSVEDDA